MEDPGSTGSENVGISRFPDGTDTDQNNVDLSLRCSTPGEANAAESSNCVLPNTDLVINEIDYDQPSTDTAEFVEIRNNGDLAPDLTGWTLEFVNGSGDAIYDTINLPAVSLALVITLSCVPTPQQLQIAIWMMARIPISSRTVRRMQLALCSTVP